jgi:hypothetical protein
MFVQSLKLDNERGPINILLNTLAYEYVDFDVEQIDMENLM